ncbi:hypothetical protein KKF59_04260 [Patescibacteria group bacterium]|nr:hypothetical protein [Patescibacteria group bacterium]MBU1034647.1 hypothetical protein [Patescibacteria group bacterium]MBU1908307.1 hypothetical protein [Patescibacteria group bacterium]
MKKNNNFLLHATAYSVLCEALRRTAGVQRRPLRKMSGAKFCAMFAYI